MGILAKGIYEYELKEYPKLLLAFLLGWLCNLDYISGDKVSWYLYTDKWSIYMVNLNQIR